MNQIQVNGLPIYNKNYIKTIDIIISKMLNTLENPYLTRGGKPIIPKYPDDLIGGIEIETCISKDFSTALTFYKDVGDLTITCKEGYRESEFIADPVPGVPNTFHYHSLISTSILLEVIIIEVLLD